MLAFYFEFNKYKDILINQNFTVADENIAIICNVKKLLIIHKYQNHLGKFQFFREFFVLSTTTKK